MSARIYRSFFKIIIPITSVSIRTCVFHNIKKIRHRRPAAVTENETFKEKKSKSSPFSQRQATPPSFGSVLLSRGNGETQTRMHWRKKRTPHIAAVASSSFPTRACKANNKRRKKETKNVYVYIYIIRGGLYDVL